MAKTDPPFPPQDLYKALPVPVIGPWIARLGYAADLLAFPCHPTPTIWIYAAGTAGLRAIASLIKPYPLAEAFAALGSKGRRHGGKRPKLGGLSGRSYGYLAALEELTLEQKGMKGAYWNWLKIPGELFFKAEWYLYVADVTTDGLINWITNAYAYQGCVDPDLQYAQGTATNEVMLGFDPYLDMHWQHSGLVIAAGPTVLTPGGMDIQVTCSISWGHISTLPPPVDVVPVIEIDGEVTNGHAKYQYDANTKTGQTTYGYSRRSKSHSGHIVTFKVHSSGGWLIITKAFAQVSCTPNTAAALLPDP